MMMMMMMMMIMMIRYKDSVASPSADGNWRVKPTSYRLPGQTFGDWLQDPEERERRQRIVT